MFEALQGRFQNVFKSLRVQGVLNEEVVDETLREVRLALLEADVNLSVVKALLDRVRVKALGEEIRSSFSGGQEVVRIVRFLRFRKNTPRFSSWWGCKVPVRQPRQANWRFGFPAASGDPCWFQRTFTVRQRANNSP
jgi:hypothetical protein